MNDYTAMVLHRARINELMRESKQEALVRVVRDQCKNGGGVLAAFKRLIRRIPTDAGANLPEDQPCHELIA